jgi:Ca2+-binding RTX toxin-like protein
LDGGPGNDVLVGGPGADAFVISPDSGNDVIKDFVAGPGAFDHLAVMDIEPEQLRFHDTRDGVLVSWNTDGGDGSVLLQGVYKHDLYQNDLMFADDRHLIDPTTADAGQVTAEHFVRNGGNEAAPPTPGDTDPQYQSVFDGNHVAFGSDGQKDVFQATANDDFNFGRGGDDSLHGGVGDDHLDGGAGADLLDGGAGQDDLRGGAGADRLYGGSMNDSLMGDAGDDYLSAGEGHDMLDGGAGNDTYHGGDGADAFIVAHGSGNDVVLSGFDPGPGAFDHVAFKDIMPNEVSVADATSTHGDDHAGVLVSWGDGSIFLEGLTKSQMAQDDFMFNAVEGGAFVPDPQINTEGSQPIFHGAHPDWQIA